MMFGTKQLISKLEVGWREILIRGWKSWRRQKNFIKLIFIEFPFRFRPKRPAVESGRINFFRKSSHTRFRSPLTKISDYETFSNLLTLRSTLVAFSTFLTYMWLHEKSENGPRIEEKIPRSHGSKKCVFVAHQKEINSLTSNKWFIIGGGLRD